MPGLYGSPSGRVDYVLPDLTSRPFRDIHYRLALAYSINRVLNTSRILHGTWAPLNDILPRGTLGYYQAPTEPHFDLGRARAELKQCPGGIHRVKMPYPEGRVEPWIDDEWRAIERQWNKIGIGVKLEFMGYPWYGIATNPLSRSHTRILASTWAQDFADPYDFLTLMLRAGQQFDVSGFNNKEYNRLVDSAAVTQSRAKRAQIYIRAQHIALSLAVWIPVANLYTYELVNPKVHGFVGGEAFWSVVPKNNDWANITVSSKQRP